MRSGIDAPTEGFSPEVVGRMRGFLDGQRPIELAVWVRHEQQGVEGPLYDHHTMLGVDDERYSAADLAALEQGIGLECPGIPGWLDLFPLSEVEELREFGEVVWERSDELGELDPLDFHFTHEPIAVTPEARSVFVELVREAAPAVVLVHASHARLWKGDRELDGQTSIYVGWDESRHGSPDTLRLVQEAARRGRNRLFRRLAGGPGRASVVRDGALPGVGRMSLAMRDVCERCGAGLAPDGGAFICSYECTFCRSCAEAMDFVCPNCSGELVARPKRLTA